MIDGVYGIMEEPKLVPRWTFPVRRHMDVRAVTNDEIQPLSNTVSAVRMVAPIHRLHSAPEVYDEIYDGDLPPQTVMDGRHGEDEFEVDLTDTIDSVRHKRGRMLKFQKREEDFRNRNKADDMEPENIVNIGTEELTEIRQTVEDSTKIIRDYFLKKSIPLLLGYDIAAGEVEAISGDQLKTPFAIDGEIFDYLERISVGGLISKQLSGVVSTDVADHVMKDWYIKELDALRQAALDRAKAKKGKHSFRRALQEFEGLIAREDGAKSANVGVVGKLSNRGGLDEYYLDR